MEHCYLLLWLEGPLQSWGFDSCFNRRDTLEFPTKSGVLGLILNAMGRDGEQRELLAELALLPHTCYRLDWSKTGKTTSSLLHDFQMVGAGYDKKDTWKRWHIPRKSDGNFANGGGAKLTHRYYLQDTIFAVIVAIPENLSGEIIEALQKPTRQLYLGRRSCTPTEFIYQGTFDDACLAEERINKLVANKVAERNSESRGGWQLLQTCILTDDENVASTKNGCYRKKIILNDVPVQFGEEKIYRDREVIRITL